MAAAGVVVVGGGGVFVCLQCGWWVRAPLSVGEGAQWLAASLEGYCWNSAEYPPLLCTFEISVMEKCQHMITPSLTCIKLMYNMHQ